MLRHIVLLSVFALLGVYAATVPPSASLDAAPEVVPADDQEVPAQGEFQDDQIPGTANVNDTEVPRELEPVAASTGTPSITEVKLSTESGSSTTTEKSAIQTGVSFLAAAVVTVALMH